MSHKNKCLKMISVAAAVMITASSLTACGEDTMYIGSLNGSDVPAGIYIYSLLGAYYEAQDKMTENDTDVFAITIEDKNASDWMISKAKDDVRRYLAVEQKFDEYGLSLSEDEVNAAQINIDSMWEYYGEVYEGYGISKDSFLKCYKNTLKSDKIFAYVYGDGGERAVPEDDIKAYMAENYALINYISMNLVDGEGNLLKSDGKAERMEMAKDYVERAKNGESFDALNAEYTKYFDELKAAAEAAAAETAVSESDNAAGGQIDFETVMPSDAEAMSDESETSAVTSAPEADSETETSYTTADIGALLADETDSGEEPIAIDDVTPVEPEEPAETEYPSNKKVIKKDSAVPDKTVCDKVFNEINPGDITIVEEDEYYYVVYKMDIAADPSYFINAEESLLYEMKEEDYKSLCEEWAAAVDFDINEKAVARYVPQKFAEEEKS